MKSITNIYLIVFVLMVLGFSAAEAQERIAEQAYQIFQAHCMNCHGDQGSHKEILRIDREMLIESGTVVPGDALGSEFYRRITENTVVKPQMPSGAPPLSAVAIDTVRRWILAGAPDWVVSRDVNFITPVTSLTRLSAHLSDLPAFDRPYARYFTMTHLYNAGDSPVTLELYRTALSKLINSLSWGSDVINPVPIDPEETLYYIDLRDYEWDRVEAWREIEAVYPYTIDYDAAADPLLFEALAELHDGTDSEVPFVHVDWFLATASLPPLYHSILGLPETDRELERSLDIDVARNLRNAPGVRVWRAGFNDSGVSNHNRVVERHTSRYGAYWKSYDFAGSAGKQNVYTHPLSFQPDGGEIIFHLPNGLQAYLIVDAGGQRIDVAPTTIVSNPEASDPAVHNGLSCIGCHTEGMKPFTDTVRAAILSEKNPAYDKDQALRLYVEKTVIDPYVEKDTELFRDALEATGADFGGLVEPVFSAHQAFIGPMSASHAAAAVGLETEAFLTEIREKSSLQSLGLLALDAEGGNVKRDAWTTNFQQVITALNTEDFVPTRTPTRTPTHDSVTILDPNLRAAIAATLGKAEGEAITSEDMLRLTRLVADNADIRDLTGLETATNLERIEFRHNAITDVSPLESLTQLNNIKLRDNQITDVRPLAKLTRVDWLGLEQNRITDLSPLSGLTKLQGIGISANPVEDVSPLATLTSLERIDAWQTPIQDFSGLAGLRVLRWIEYGNDKSTTVLPSLTGLKALRRLEIHGCGISDISALADLTQLRWLELVNNAITDISPLEDLTNLTHLNLDANLISDVSPLSELSNLNLLYLENNLISDVSPLSELPNLQRLDLRNNAVFDFSPLDDLEGVAIRMTGNPGFPTNRGAHITGPWLWAIVPGTRLDTRTDFLARATNGAATEIKVATNGAKAGKAVGKSVWTWHRLGTGGDNINRMTAALGWGTGREIYDHIVYGAVILDAPREQQTKMFVGNDDAVKVFLNGELVQTVLHATFDQDGSFFPVTLNKGKNVLLVAIDNHGHGGFTGHFAFARDAEYEVFIPGPRFVLSTEATDFEIEDTFTIELGVENMDGLSGWQADFVFNPAVLNAVEVNEGDFLKESDEQTYFEAGTIENSSGKITGLKALRLSGDSVDGNGLLCTVTFTVVGTGECRLTLENFEAGSARGILVPSIPPELSIIVEGDKPTIPAWDVNEDGITNVSDVILVVAALGQSPPENPRTDINGDGVVDGKDLAIVAAHLGEGAAGAAPFADPQSLGLTPENVEEVLDLLRAADDGSLTFRRGIANIEALYATFVPEKTDLLPNYPNPFNPETWIPYHLAKPATVTLTIYGANGTVVRTLSLGHQPAGIYQTRSRAAYWDGKNGIGEPVASGIYFITLTANDFTTTRKMLLMK